MVDDNRLHHTAVVLIHLFLWSTNRPTAIKADMRSSTFSKINDITYFQFEFVQFLHQLKNNYVNLVNIIIKMNFEKK